MRFRSSLTASSLIDHVLPSLMHFIRCLSLKKWSKVKESDHQLNGCFVQVYPSLWIKCLISFSPEYLIGSIAIYVYLVRRLSFQCDFLHWKLNCPLHMLGQVVYLYFTSCLPPTIPLRVFKQPNFTRVKSYINFMEYNMRLTGNLRD